MKFGLNLRNFLSDLRRPMYEQIEETADLVRRGTGLGFWGAYAPHHWISHPTIWLQPFPVLARLAAENDTMKLITGVLLLPLQNPVDIAEQVVTMDHISNGRFILGLGLGYRDKELEIAGTNRKERVGRLEESMEIMELLWSGEEVNFQGKYWTLNQARLGLRPVQTPRPAIWLACQSPGATRRAALKSNGCLIGPYVGWSDLEKLNDIYWTAREENNLGDGGIVAAHRCISVAADRETAIRQAQITAEANAAMYGGWSMQEKSMVDLRLEALRDIEEWAIVGNATECAEQIAKYDDERNVGYMGLTFLNLPTDPNARTEYIQHVSEGVMGGVNG